MSTTVDEYLAGRYEQAILSTLGPPVRMISASKTGYRDRHPDHLPVFNANVCLGAAKIWFGDIDLTLDEPKLLDLASCTGHITSLL